MLDIIQNNPYHILGVYANSSMRERLANITRIKAFLKVGKQISFPTDFPYMLPQINRTQESVTEAESQLSLPDRQIYHAQFWLLKITSFDDIALNNLSAGNIETAMDIWSKKDNASSLQNRIVCALIAENTSGQASLFPSCGYYKTAVECAEKLYDSFRNDFLDAVLGENRTVGGENIEYAFLDSLATIIDAQDLLQCITNPDWRRYVSKQQIDPLIASLQAAVAYSKQERKKGPAASLASGRKLIKDTKVTLLQLRKLLPDTDIQYQVIADKLGNEILQCGIDYYNHTYDPDTDKNTMELMNYAMTVVVGPMAKARVKDNLIPGVVGDDNPPASVKKEAEVVDEWIERYERMPITIQSAVTLLNNTRPYLQEIKSKLGTDNNFYLYLSTQIVKKAQHNVVEEVNKEMNLIKGDSHIMFIIKSTLETAWAATRIMDAFDLETDSKQWYQNNRATLEKICIQSGIDTKAFMPKSPIPSPKLTTTNSTIQTVSTKNGSVTKTRNSISSDKANKPSPIVDFLIKFVCIIGLIIYYGWWLIALIILLLCGVLD